MTPGCKLKYTLTCRLGHLIKKISTMNEKDDKTNILNSWLFNYLKEEPKNVSRLKGDASFRQYYRVQSVHGNLIAMASPSLSEPILPFVSIANSWHRQGIAVPRVLHYNLKLGFALLTDFGDVLLQDKLDKNTADVYYKNALERLPAIQESSRPKDYIYPLFDEKHIHLELSYFKEWFIEKLLGLEMSVAESKMLDGLFAQLIDICDQQPQTVIHRDYHSRNLMVLENNALGILDFQDAMLGPITYDAASLLRDCYVDWPIDSVYRWLAHFYEVRYDEKLKQYSFAQFQEWFDKVGLQRHIKVLGIFSRLKIRDGKAGYLKDIPRILNYVLQVTAQYPQLKHFEQWLILRVIPQWEAYFTTLESPQAVAYKQAGSA